MNIWKGNINLLY